MKCPRPPPVSGLLSASAPQGRRPRLSFSVEVMAAQFSPLTHAPAPVCQSTYDMDFLYVPIHIGPLSLWQQLWRHSRVNTLNKLLTMHELYR